MIERLLEMGLSGFIISGFIAVFGPIFNYFSNRPRRFDDSFFEYLLTIPFGAFLFYFISLYGISCILFGLILRNPTPRRHANIMVAAFCVHVIGYYFFLVLYDQYTGGRGLVSLEQVLLELLPLPLMIGASGIPAVWIANYVGGVFYRWAIARSGKTTLTS
jgi:hypothetical protein